MNAREIINHVVKMKDFGKEMGKKEIADYANGYLKGDHAGIGSENRLSVIHSHKIVHFDAQSK